MNPRVASFAMIAAVLIAAVAGCGKAPDGAGAGPGGGAVVSAIAFFQNGADCDIVRDDTVDAHSDDDVTWAVSVRPPCNLDGQTVEIQFTDGGDPGRCQCSDTIRNNKAKLKLKVKKHGKHEGYTYNIRVAGKTFHPRLEVDP